MDFSISAISSPCNYPSFYICYISVIAALTASLFASLTFFNSALKDRTDSEANKNGALDEIVNSAIKARSSIIRWVCCFAIITLLILFIGLLISNWGKNLYFFKTISYISFFIISTCITFFIFNTNIDNLIQEEAKLLTASNLTKIEECITIRGYRSESNKSRTIKNLLKASTPLDRLDFFDLAYYRILQGTENGHFPKCNDIQQLLQLIAQIEQCVNNTTIQNIQVCNVRKSKPEESFTWLYSKDKYFDKTEPVKSFHKLQVGIQNERRYEDALRDLTILQNSAKNIAYRPTKNASSEPDGNWKVWYRNIQTYCTKSLRETTYNFFKYYNILLSYRNALWENQSNNQNTDRQVPYILASILHRVLLDRYLSNIRLARMNMGSSDFSKAWLTYSDLSGSNLNNSNFKFAHLRNTTLTNCDLTSSNFYLADAREGKFSGSNMSNCSFVGTILDNCDLSTCLLDNIIFHHPLIDRLYRQEIEYDAKYPKKQYTLYELLQMEEKSIELLKKRLNEPTSIAKDILNAFFDSQETEIPIRLNQFIESKEKFHIDDSTFKALNDDSQKEDINSYTKALIKKLEFRYRAYSQDERRLRHDIPFPCRAIASIRQATINNVLLKDVDFSHIELSGTSLQKSTLTGCLFHYTHAEGAIFDRANLKKSDFTRADLTAATLKESNLFETIFLNCQCEASSFQSANMVNALICGSTKPLKDTVAPGAQSDNTSNYSNVNFSQTEAQNIKIYNTYLEKATIRKANWGNVHLVNSHLAYASLFGTDMTYGALLYDTFSHANLKSAILTDALLFHCNFKEATLEEAVLLRALISHTDFIATNLQKVNFSGADIRNTRFEDCSFGIANFTNAKFTNCIFVHVDLRNTLGIDKTTFTNCTFGEKVYHPNLDRKQNQ
ncbi:MAG: pentapeptide repeat-containing protein [Clostridia bacterium]|nr:pentapeptide repeat-containing protein [Clostridia bacterium]